MPQTSWEELNEIIHNVKDTLTKIVGIEIMCKKIKIDAVSKMEGIEKYCDMVKRDAQNQLDRLNDIILYQIDDKKEEDNESDK